MAKIYFLPSHCQTCDILNEEAFAENNDSGKEGPLVDYELTVENLATFLDKEGSSSLYKHLQRHLPEEILAKLSYESERRVHLDAIHRGDIIHLPYQGSGAAVAEACRAIFHPNDCGDIDAMPFNEALGYARNILMEYDVENPEEFLRDKGVFLE